MSAIVTQTYSVSGEFDDGVSFVGSDQITMIGHRLGDVNGSGVLGTDDGVFLLQYIFSNRRAFRKWHPPCLTCT